MQSSSRWSRWWSHAVFPRSRDGCRLRKTCDASCECSVVLRKCCAGCEHVFVGQYIRTESNCTIRDVEGDVFCSSRVVDMLRGARKAEKNLLLFRDFMVVTATTMHRQSSTAQTATTTSFASFKKEKTYETSQFSAQIYLVPELGFLGEFAILQTLQPPANLHLYLELPYTMSSPGRNLNLKHATPTNEPIIHCLPSSGLRLGFNRPEQRLRLSKALTSEKTDSHTRTEMSSYS